MQRVPTRLLKSGMVLASPVVDSRGSVVLPKDVEASERMIDALERSRIQSVLVKGAPIASPVLPAVGLNERLATMEAAFAPSKGNDLMEKLRVIVKAHFIRRDAQLRGILKDGE